MKKIVLFVLAVMVIASCSVPVTQDITESTSLEVESTASGSSDMVNVLHANAYGVGGSTAIVNGYVEVDDTASVKEVSVIYTIIDSGEWNEVEATFISPTTNGLERWFFILPAIEYTDNVSVQFAAKYIADGIEYWDNNNGNDYVLGNGIDLGRQFVLGKPAVFVKSAGCFQNGSDYSFNGQLVLKNLAYEKDVDIIYTTDNWVTTQIGTASYYDGPYSNNNCEDWTFNITITGPVTGSLEFAIAYNVNGTTYWDNNFGENYDLGQGGYLYW